MSAQWADADMYDENGLHVVADLPELAEDSSGQMRIGYRLASRYRNRLLHVTGLGWHFWDGKRWARDDGERDRDAVRARRAVHTVLRDAWADAFHDKDLQRDVRKCESDSGVSGVLGIAADLLHAAAADMDADPNLLNVANGTFDLTARTLRPHDPADRITKVCRGAYRPDTDTSVWGAFLARVVPDCDELAYLQRVFGLAAYGRVREHMFPILTGVGANGKGTTYGAVTFAMGDYATVINPEMLMAQDTHSKGRPDPDMMDLRMTRLVVASEVKEGRKLDAAVMKRLTGGDELKARDLYHGNVKWQPTHQIVYVTNHKPVVKGNDPAVWRRVRVVPFNVVVPESEQDLDLGTKLELHADAVLSWVIDGYFDGLDNGGMRAPESVTKATSTYQVESDSVARFVAQRCVTGTWLHERARSLYAAWQSWSLAEGAEQLSETAFAKELERLGFESRRTSAGVRRAGLELKPEDDDDA